MFSLILPDIIHGFSDEKLTFPLTDTLPPDDSISLRIPINREVLPQPTVPTINNKSPGNTFKVILCKHSL